MAFRTLQAFLAAALVAGVAHGQANEDGVIVPGTPADYDNQLVLPEGIVGSDMVTVPGIAVHYDRVVSPETFTLNEDFAWAVRAFLRREETFGKAVIMYGYATDTACNVSAVQNLSAPAALAIPPRLDTVEAEPNGLYSVTLYETVADACGAREVVQELANANASAPDITQLLTDGTNLEAANAMLASRLSGQVRPASWSAEAGPTPAWFNANSELLAELGATYISIPGYLPVDTGTAASFALEIGEIEMPNEDSLIFSVGRLPDTGEGLELWAFCAEVDQCFGHQADDSFTSRHFAGLIDDVPEDAAIGIPLTGPP